MREYQQPDIKLCSPDEELDINFGLEINIRKDNADPPCQ